MHFDGEPGALRAPIHMKVLPDELEAWVRLAREERRRWLAAGVPMAARRPLLLEALVALHAGRIPGPAHAPAGSGQP